MAAFCRMRALTTRFNDDPEAASRPFDSMRSGFVMAEGAAILVLEELDHATARGAPCLAEVSGYGLSGDAHHITAPHESGDAALRAMQAALRNSGYTPDAIDYVNAHATSTPSGDDVEGLAIDRFSGGSSALMVSSTKGSTGHLLGAAGAVEAAFTVLALKEGVVPGTRNLREPSQAFGWTHASLDPSVHFVERKLNAALSNSFGFGGTNASLLLTAIR
uniref:beta-ketoacyl-[acyl-carrier-protein] synthase I n=1 Tax=Octactis speculum TaxID=3111310 RepID=A0A7S2CPZ7_9STRA